MKAVVVIAFYVWLALTVAIVLGRLARWSASRQAAKRRRKAREAARSQQVAVPVAAGRSPHEETIDLDAPVGPRPSEMQPEHREPANVPSASIPEPQAEEVAQIAERRNADRRGGERRQGDRRSRDRREPVDLDGVVPEPVAVAPEPTPPSAPVTVPTPTPTPTLAHLLAGIAIPGDLVPIVAQGAAANEYSSTMISRQRPAHEVGAGIADELERLGYALEPIGLATLRATRGGDVLTVEIDPEPARPDDRGVVRFPTAAPNDVIVEFWVGDGPRPV
ncbi:MAG: hypothetical protein R2733_25145 [Acidimicrobiales bacterium]